MALTKISGSVIKDSVSLSGNVSVGGTLTYQDVTNVDALGIGTFRTGINVSGGQIDVGSNIKIGNAGIITATELDISGDIDVDGHTELDNVNIAGIVTVSSDGINAGILDLKTGNNLRLRFSSGGTAQFRGDTDPIASFDRGSANSTNVKWGYLGADRGIISSISNEFRITASGTTPMTFHSNGNERLRIDSSGRLIKGHTATYAIAGHYPSIQLSGTDYNGATLGIINNANDATGAYIQLSKQRSGSPNGATIVQNNDLVGNITFTAADGTDLTSRIAEIKGMVDGTPGSNDTPGRLSFWTTPDGAQSSLERLRIDSSGDIGLGESNPNRSGYSSPVTSVGYNSSNGYGVLELLGNQTSDNTIANIVAYNVGGSSRLAAIAFERSGANNSGAIRFETYASGSSSEILRITSNKRVSIGDRTSNPDEQVHIHTASGDARVHIEGASDAELKLTSHSGDSSIFMGDSASGSIGKINYDHAGDDFIFTAGGNTRGRIYNDAGVTGMEHHRFMPFLIGYDIQTTSSITMTKGFGGMSRLPINADGDTAYMSYVTHWRHRQYALVRFWYGASGNTSGSTFDWDFTVWSATNNEGYSVGSNHSFTVTSGSMSNGKMYGYNILSSWPSHHTSELVQFKIEYDELQEGTSLQLVGLELVEYTTA